MMITPKTTLKIENLKTLVKANDKVDHYSYATLYEAHKGAIPSWNTLKKHGLVKFDGTALKLVKTYGGNYEALNVNMYSYNL